MTISIDIGKFEAEIEYISAIGKRSRKVELEVMWHSCWVYQVTYYRPRDAEDHVVVVTKDWYPPNINISFTPEQFDKVVELYPLAPKNERDQCYKPFYEDYDLSRGMFDFGDDVLFQAFKSPQPTDDERVYLVRHCFSYGTPTPDTAVLGLHVDDLKKLKELLDSKKNEIFYSGCKISWPSKILGDL
jgi:hypothetical protein